MKVYLRNNFNERTGYTPEAHFRPVAGQDKMKYYNVTGIAFVPGRIPGRGKYALYVHSLERPLTKLTFRMHQLVSIGHDQRLYLWDYSCIIPAKEPLRSLHPSDHRNVDDNDVNIRDEAQSKPETNPHVVSECKY
jgi:hypothetical protein